MLKRSFQKLTNEALATLASATVKIVTDTACAANPLFNAVESAHIAFFAVLDKPTYSGTGGEIFALDKRKDKVYAGLYGY